MNFFRVPIINFSFCDDGIGFRVLEPRINSLSHHCPAKSFDGMLVSFEAKKMDV